MIAGELVVEGLHRHGVEAFQALVHGVLDGLGFQEHVRLEIDDLVLKLLVDVGLLFRIGRLARLVDQGIDCWILQPLGRSPACPPPSNGYCVKNIESGDG